MANRTQIVLLIRDGHCPSYISRNLGISVTATIEQLWACVGMGAIRVTDVFFSFRGEQIRRLKSECKAKKLGDQIDEVALNRLDLVTEEVELFEIISTKQVYGEELYEYISEIETAIHQFIKGVLKKEFGEGETGWWREGITLDIRQKCQGRREEDDDPSDSVFAYTDLIDLSKIIQKNWPLFKDLVDPEYGQNRRKMLSDFVILNNFRKAIMHPVKKKQWTEEDYRFIRNFRERFWHLEKIQESQ